jgi:DNA-binding NarL/FixJ family response regulator
VVLDRLLEDACAGESGVLDVEVFAGRAERELPATGERVRTRTVETRDELTTQEAQIPRLAGEGLSNAEIGARLRRTDLTGRTRITSRIDHDHLVGHPRDSA